MKLVVTGKTGQVARALAGRATKEPDLQVTLIGRPEFDLRRPSDIPTLVADAHADILVSSAAMTNVDEAEADPTGAFAVNAEGPRVLAEAAAALGMPIIHISTDYVFDGRGNRPCTETDAANPRHLIFRTAWVYGPFGKNFATLILERARHAASIDVAADQTGSPTSALALAEGIVAAARAALAPDFDAWGIYHLAGPDTATRAELARRILAADATLGGPLIDVRDAPPTEGARVPRPRRSHLNSGKFARTFGWTMPDWSGAVLPVVRQIRTAA
jgi:dTDP-4-dehydrorhamnose reductase